MNTLQGVTEFLTLYPSRLRTPRRITKNLSPGGGALLRPNWFKFDALKSDWPKYEAAG